ncbi:MAG TPA: DUF1326 domain-containing protein [Acidimicrobiia bacterium]|nr:DUF1326 domain-containing protein [Acidimicrobiia bacterium]
MPETSVANWRVRGTYFEACNCDAICPCRSVHHQASGPSTYGECYGSLSWHILEGHADEIDLGDLMVVMSLRYYDKVQPSSRWEVVLYVDERATDQQLGALSDIFLGRVGGTAFQNYARAIGTVYDVRRARISVEHLAARRRIDVVGYLHVESEGDASATGDVQCGIPGFDHPGTELFGQILQSTEEHLRWDIMGKRNASFASDFDYRSDQ